jgi:hypothetical protein
VIVGPLQRDALLYVTENLREWDRREVFAMSWTDDPAELTDVTMANNSFAFSIHADDNEPVAAIGALEVWPGLWQPWAYGTDRFNLIARSLTKFVRKRFIPTLAELGWRTAECFSMVGHHESHAWLKMTGAERAGFCPAFGKNGEDFVRFVWYNGDRVDRRPPES